MDYTLISIMVAIVIFVVSEFLKNVEHNQNQINLLKCLKFKIREIEDMIKSYKELLIPYYKLPLPDESFYFRNLDSKIGIITSLSFGKKTIDLKNYINRIQDKCLIINYMIEEMQKEWNNGLNKKKIPKKVLDYYYPRIIKIMDDSEDKRGLPYSIKKVKDILGNRFKLYNP